MIENHYPKFKKLIDEYEQDKAQFSSDKEILSYYPQIFLLAIVSTFEKEIKEKCSNIITHPAISLQSLPQLAKIVNSRTPNCSDEIYKKFRAREKNGILELNADGFYNIFGGTTFKQDVESNFLSEQQSQTGDYIKLIAILKSLIGKGDKYDNDYTEKEYIFNILKSLTFANAESSFLELKLRRNKVAHNFIFGISDSFEDICKLYYESVLYIIAVKLSLSKLSTS